MNRATRIIGIFSAAVLATTALGSCSLIGGDGDDERASVTLVVHGSFDLPPQLVKEFEDEHDLKLKVSEGGDGGALTNLLALNASNPTGDVAFGVDNTFASRAIDEGVFAEYDVELSASAEALRLEGEGANRMIPIDQGSVCVNIDTVWFDTQGVTPPQTLADLTSPAYKNLFAIPGASTSTPGMAFLLATIAEFGDTWPDYWRDLMANGAKLSKGWSDAYEGDFTGASENGKQPIVVSYDTSPAFTVGDDGKTSTKALLDTCFRQVEYAGVLTNAKNPEGARAVIDFLISDEVQAALPTSMYVFPVNDGVDLPQEWARFAEQPTKPYAVAPEIIAANRTEWLTEWTDITSR